MGNRLDLGISICFGGMDDCVCLDQIVFPVLKIDNKSVITELDSGDKKWDS